jgi:[protein-PII] uridylyltransferase
MRNMSSVRKDLRRAYEEKRTEVRDHFFRSLDGPAALEALTAAADELVRSAFECHPGPFCILATGGYGRREFYPHSDVDLLFLHEAEEAKEAERCITSTLHRLWDSGLVLGQQVWTLDEISAPESLDPDSLLSLLDARLVAGGEEFGDRFLGATLPRLIDGRRQSLLDHIAAVTRERHNQGQNTIYQLEPDLKQSPGGLRDYLTAAYVGKICEPAPELPQPFQDVQGAHGFLSRLRILLHFLKGRNQNQLTHRLQEELVRHLGYGQEDLRSAVESLMKEYFLNARVVYGFCVRTVVSMNRENPTPKIEFSAGAGGPHPWNAEAMLGLFQRSLLENLPLGESARGAVIEGLATASTSLGTPGVRQRLREILKPRFGLYRTLSEMYELGVLELLLPEFGSIKARMVRDFYHRYTVDEHSLLAIKSIEDLLVADDPSERRFRSLLEEIPSPELLTLSLLLHDVGKSREGAHVDRSARMATKALRRFHFDGDEMDQVLFLIRQHLTMSSTVFRRDLEDREIVGRFADLVRDPLRLRLLTLLTFADIKAVGPGVLTEWKKDLLWQLYVAAYNKLTLGFGEERIEDEGADERLLSLLPEDLDKEAFKHFLEGFPRRYLDSVSPPEIYQHYRLSVGLDAANPVQTAVIDRGGHFELCVVTPDRYFLFAKIVGLLSYFEMNILRGYGFSNRQNRVLDFFQFDDTRGVFRLNPGEKDRFRDLLTAAVREEVSVERLLEGKERSVVFRPLAPPFPPSVFFDEEHSRDYTILEIVAPDSIGLLYRVGAAISQCRCNIELVLISTEGSKAVDVFYLTHEGKTLDFPLRQELKERILTALGATPAEKRQA